MRFPLVFLLSHPSFVAQVSVRFFPSSSSAPRSRMVWYHSGNPGTLLRTHPKPPNWRLEQVVRSWTPRTSRSPTTLKVKTLRVSAEGLASGKVRTEQATRGSAAGPELGSRRGAGGLPTAAHWLLRGLQNSELGGIVALYRHLPGKPRNALSGPWVLSPGKPLPGFFPASWRRVELGLGAASASSQER